MTGHSRILKTINIGCCGFPIEKEQYYHEFDCIEINITFYQLPQIATAEKWRLAAKKQNQAFEFIIKAWQIITHPPGSFTYRRLKEKIGLRENYGFFKDTNEVLTAWQRTRDFALKLGCKKILFQCPPSFKPEEKYLSNLYGFFHRIDKDHTNFDFILEVRGAEWHEKIIQKVCQELNLIHCVDPLYQTSYYGDYRYYRLHGLHIGNRLDYDYTFSDRELGQVLSQCDQKLNYVMFNNSTMYNDALRLRAFNEQ